MTFPRKSISVILLLTAAASCERSPVQPRPNMSAIVTGGVASLKITPSGDNYAAGILYPGTTVGPCEYFDAIATDENGNQVSNPVVTWMVGDDRIAYFRNNFSSQFKGTGSAFVCGKDTGYGYSEIDAWWTSPG